MPLKIKFDLEIGQSVYLVNDPQQLEYIVVGAIARPGAILYIIDYLGDEIEVYNFELSTTPNLKKKEEDS